MQKDKSKREQDKDAERPGLKEQREAAEQQQESPGEPARGE
jgi:hypothetical protein